MTGELIGADLAGAAHDILDILVEDMRRPDVRAGLAVSLVTVAIMARLGARFPSALFTALLAGAAAEQMYGMVAVIAEGVEQLQADGDAT